MAVISTLLAVGAILGNIVLASIGFVIGFAFSPLGIGLLIFGGISMALGHKEENGIAASPTYGASTLQSQTNNSLPQPLLYGKVKVAGNRIWQADDVSTNVTRLVCFAEGEINAFTDIRLNDLKSTDISGITIEKYYGNGTQNISTMVQNTTNTATTNADRAEVVGGLRHMAYLAIKVPRSNDIDGSYNLTTIVEGRKVRIYTDEDTYTVAYSNNPAWCLLDFLTSYNGGRIGILNTGLRDDDIIKNSIDIDSFIEAAAYCDEVITSYQYITALTGNNNDLIWLGRHADKALSITYTAGATAGIAITDNDITVTFVNGTTKASDVIGLVQSSLGVSEVVKVYNADDNDGTGLVSTLAKTVFTADNTSKRFTFNMIFDSNWLVSDIIEEFKKNCRGAFVNTVHTDLSGKKILKLAFKIEKPEVVSYVFDKTMIIQGSETITMLERSQRYDNLDLKYIEPNISDPEGESGEWSKCVARASLETPFNEPSTSHSVEMYSVTNFKQASRLAWFYLNRNIRCYMSGTFATDERALQRQIGDVVSLSDFVMDFDALPVRIMSITQSDDKVFTITWNMYDADIYNDEIASLDPVIIYTPLNDPYAYPADISSFNASQNQRLVEFSWTGLTDPSVTYEIRQGANWNSASVVATGLLGTSYTTTLTQRGTFTYWIKAKTPKQYSQNATSDILNVQYLPDLNVVVNQNILEGASGSFSGNRLIDSNGNYLVNSYGNYLTDSNSTMYIYNNKLKLNATSLWQDLTSIKWLAIGSRYYADMPNNWGSSVEKYGTYTSQVYDIGADLQNIVSFNWDLYSTDSQQSVTIEWRYSEDDITYSSWTLANTGSFKFRYYQVRVTFNNPNGAVMYLNDLIVTIDVPDRNEAYTNREVTVANDGVSIVYSADTQSKIADDFIIVEPHVLATPLSNNTYAVVTSSTSTGCTVKLYTNDGSLTTGFVNISVSGY